MLKLLQINTCITQSTGRIAQQIGEKAIDEGWESYIAFPARTPIVASKSKLIKIGSKVDQYFHALMTRVLIVVAFFPNMRQNDSFKRLKILAPM